MSTNKHLTTSEVAAEYRRSEYTVRLALRDQSLHGEKPRGSNRWLVESGCAKAWSSGEQCEHYTQNVRLFRARKHA